MKERYATLPALLLLLALPARSQTIWTGPPITFTKADNADWTLEENQDRITGNVWLTRQTTQGLFNIATETGYTANTSPADTEWAFGTTGDIGTLAFSDWESAHGGNPPSMIGQDMVLRLVTDNVYIDIRFLAWTTGGLGGGFSYTRSTDPSTGTRGTVAQEGIQAFPNPAQERLTITGVPRGARVSVRDASGRVVLEAPLNEGTLGIGTLVPGPYLLRLADGRAFRFVKG